MKPKFKVKTTDQILIDVPKGKPHSSGSIVKQKAQKGPACFYYSAKLLWQQEGKPSKNKDLSKLRRSIAELEKQHNTEKTLLNTLKHKKVDITNKNEILIQAPLILTLGQFQGVISQNEVQIAKNLLDKFKHDTTNDFENYLKHKHVQERIDIEKIYAHDQHLNISFFNAENATTRTEILNFKVPPENNKKSELAKLRYLTILKMVDKQHLALCDWSPNDSIDKLFKILTTVGIVMAGGSLGKTNYSEAPFELKEKVGGEQIFGWKPNTFINASEGHAICIIGASKNVGPNKKSYIYFYDPLDESDPSSSKARPTYIMSYDNFCQRVNPTLELENNKYYTICKP